VKYLVTGAAGFIGSHLTRALLDAGHEVVAVDSFSDYYDPARKEENAAGLGVVRADLAVDPVAEIVAGTDGIFHLAGQPGVRAFGQAFPDYLTRNVLATQRLFEAAAEEGVRVVYASSSSIYGDAERYPTPESTLPRPNSPYGITKLACEHLAGAYARSFGLQTVGLRYFTVYGPRQRPDMAFTRIAEALAEGRPFELYGDGGQSRSFTYVADVVEATVAALGGVPGAIYNVGGETEATMREAIELFERISGRALELRRGPPAAGDMRRTKADTTRIRADLGWEAVTSLEDGLRAQWEWASGRVAAR
jgi:UDP-glucuronate 4-epimerase